MTAVQLPPIPQQIPRTQADWERLVNVLQTWQTATASPVQQTPAERTGNITPLITSYLEGDARRYGSQGNGSSSSAADTAALTSLFKFAPDRGLIPGGTYSVTAKIQTLIVGVYEGGPRANTVIQSASGFADYVLEVGNGSTNPQAGRIAHLRFFGTAGNLGQLHMNSLCHMWRLEDLLFDGGCPGLVIDDCWDSNYTSIDMLNAGNAGGTPATGASLIIRGGCNNLYFRGLRIETAPAGAIYLNNANNIRIQTGKIDNEAAGGQLAPAITISDRLSQLIIDQFSINGMNGQYAISTQGELRLGQVTFLGGTGMDAHILDQRAWFHLDNNSVGGAARGSFGPTIPRLLLGQAHFGYGLVSFNAVTTAAVKSKIFPIRAVKNLTVTANAGGSSNTTHVTTSGVTVIQNDVYTGCYLVHNATGTQASSRRLIIACFTDGTFYVQGNASLTQDSDWSIEFCGQHATPIDLEHATLEQGTSGSTSGPYIANMSMFTKIATGCTIASIAYDSTVANATYGTTKATLTGVSASTDLTGYYLIDEFTGEPFYIGYGSDGSGVIGIMYDRTASLNTAHTYTVQAGYAADVKRVGSAYEWTYAGKKMSCLESAAYYAGFDVDNLPLWGLQAIGNAAGANDTTGEPVVLPYSATIKVDASSGREFVITATNGTAFTISDPINLVRGQRIIFTIRNTSGGALGAVTWGTSAYKLATWTSPATANSRSIEFRYDGTNLVEINRTPSDVPN